MLFETISRDVVFRNRPGRKARDDEVPTLNRPRGMRNLAPRPKGSVQQSGREMRGTGMVFECNNGTARRTHASATCSRWCVRCVPFSLEKVDTTSSRAIPRSHGFPSHEFDSGTPAMRPSVPKADATRHVRTHAEVCLPCLTIDPRVVVHIFNRPINSVGMLRYSPRTRLYEAVPPRCWPSCETVHTDCAG
jgi:hypothetical protein